MTLCCLYVMLCITWDLSQISSVRAPTLFSLYINNSLLRSATGLFMWKSLRECTLMADLAHLTNCFQKWRLKPRTPRLWQEFFICTTSGHVVNWVFSRMLNVWSTGHIQLILMLDWIIVTHTAAKLKTHNNLILKLTGTSWYASASTFCTSALAFCYSVAECHCPVWVRVLLTLNTSVPCTWFQAACIPVKFNGSSAYLLHCAV